MSVGRGRRKDIKMQSRPPLRVMPNPRFLYANQIGTPFVHRSLQVQRASGEVASNQRIKLLRMQREHIRGHEGQGRWSASASHPQSHSRLIPGWIVRSPLSLADLMPKERRLQVHHLHMLPPRRVSAPSAQPLPATGGRSLWPGNPVCCSFRQGIRNLIA